MGSDVLVLLHTNYVDFDFRLNSLMEVTERTGWNESTRELLTIHKLQRKKEATEDKRKLYPFIHFHPGRSAFHRRHSVYLPLWDRNIFQRSCNSRVVSISRGISLFLAQPNLAIRLPHLSRNIVSPPPLPNPVIPTTKATSSSSSSGTASKFTKAD
jgi:hypothetical protein